MVDQAKRRIAGKAILVSAIITTLPLAGCVINQPSAQQRAAYSAACGAKSAPQASDFIRKYPNSPMVRDLLLCLPAPTLKRLAPDAVKAISPEVVRTLPKSTLAALHLTVPASQPPVRTPRGGYDD